MAEELDLDLSCEDARNPEEHSKIEQPATEKLEMIEEYKPPQRKTVKKPLRAKGGVRKQRKERTKQKRLVGSAMQCDFCGFTTDKPASMYMHKRENHMERKFHCTLPGCEFSTNMHSRLEDHMNVHYNIRCHGCNICGKAYLGRKHLNRHMQTHKNRPRLECEDCGYNTLRSDYFNRHLKVKHNKPPIQFDRRKAENKAQIESVINSFNAPLERVHTTIVYDEAYTNQYKEGDDPWDTQEVIVTSLNSKGEIQDNQFADQELADVTNTNELDEVNDILQAHEAIEGTSFSDGVSSGRGQKPETEKKHDSSAGCVVIADDHVSISVKENEATAQMEDDEEMTHFLKKIMVEIE